MTQEQVDGGGVDDAPEVAAERLGLPPLPPGEVLLVIVGAGASYDCIALNQEYLKKRTPSAPGGKQRPWQELRPPLTKDLASATVFYNELAARYPACRPLLSELRSRLAPGGSTQQAITLEEALADYAAGRDIDPYVGRHLAAIRFYLRDLLWESSEAMLSPELTGGVTNYTRLVDHCYRWARANDGHVCFVTFNYDFLLEQACADHGWLDLAQLDSYVSHPHASVLKPHGSIRWQWASYGGLTGRANEVDQWSIDQGEPTHPETLMITTVTTGEVSRTDRRLGSTRRWPALALPMRSKTGFVWPPDQEARFAGLQGRVRRLLTIGWRALEPHFTPHLQPLVMNASRAVTVMGGDTGYADASAVVEELGLADPKHRRRIQHETVGYGFSGFLDQRLVLDWLLEEQVDWPPPW